MLQPHGAAIMAVRMIFALYADNNYTSFIQHIAQEAFFYRHILLHIIKCAYKCIKTNMKKKKKRSTSSGKFPKERWKWHNIEKRNAKALIRFRKD